MVVESVPGLSCVETVDSTKLASKLDAAVAALGRQPLSVMVQARFCCRCWRCVLGQLSMMAQLR